MGKTGGCTMRINDILFKIKTALHLDDTEMIEAYTLVAYPMSPQRLTAILKRRQDRGYESATYEELGVFLDGLIALKRGEPPKIPQAEDVPLSNNLILKKLRIALNLKEAELMIIFALVDAPLTRRQIGSLFRAENHKNFKACSDELLMLFLEGLDEFYYVGDES